MVTYDWNGRGQLQNVWSDGAATSYKYDELGNVKEMLYPNQVKTVYGYNSESHLTSVTATRNGSPRASFDYNPSDRPLARSGMRQALRETINGTSRSMDYYYDPLWRLTKETIGGAAITYDLGPGYGDAWLDRVGNRRQRLSNVSGVPTQSFGYNARDQITMGGGIDVAYDNEGNTLRFPGADQIADDEYDAEDRLVKRTGSSGVICIVYDGDGNRVRKTIGSTTTSYLVDDRNPTGHAQVLAETVLVEPSTTGLVGRWLLDESEGTVVPGWGGTGTLVNGPVWSAGAHSGGLRFDGINDSVTVPDAPSLRLQGSVTVAFWMKKDAEASGLAQLVGKSSGVRNYVVWGQAGDGRALLFQLQKYDGSQPAISSTERIELGRWHHVACTFGGDGWARIYIDGVVSGEGWLGNFSPSTSSDPVTFGYAGYHHHFGGSLDDVRIYNRVLNTSEIAGLAGSTTRYVYGHKLISQKRGTSTWYYGYDGLGSVRYLTDSAGTITDTYNYDAYGIQIGGYASTPNNYRLAGEQWDSNLEVCIIIARDIMTRIRAASGRWIRMKARLRALSHCISMCIAPLILSIV